MWLVKRTEKELDNTVEEGEPVHTQPYFMRKGLTLYSRKWGRHKAY